MAQSIRELERLFVNLKQDDPRRAAEVAFVLANKYLDAEETESAKTFGLESMRLFGLCKTDTLEACASLYRNLGGVNLPGLIHAGVVRNRLALRGLDLGSHPKPDEVMRQEE